MFAFFSPSVWVCWAVSRIHSALVTDDVTNDLVVMVTAWLQRPGHRKTFNLI